MNNDTGMTAPQTPEVDVLALMNKPVNASFSEWVEARAALAGLIDAAARHIHAVDHPVNDGGDEERQARTLRAMSAALARVQGGAK